jgi:hypothetical protein
MTDYVCCPELTFSRVDGALDNLWPLVTALFELQGGRKEES